MTDFQGPIEVTATALAKTILAEVVKSQDTLIFEMSEKTTEEQMAEIEKAADFVTEIMKLIAASDLPADYAMYPIDKLIATLSALKTGVSGAIRQSEDELMSRFYGVKHPETGKYRKELATVGDIMLKLDEVRTATGNNPEDFFNKQV